MFSKLKKPLFLLLAICLVSASFIGCDDEEDNNNNNNDDNNNQEERFEAVVEYAETFSIEAVDNNCTLLTDAEGQEFLIIPEGETAPSGYTDATQINAPVENVVILSTTYGALMRPLGILDTITGVTTEAESWYIDEIKEGMESGSIKYIGTGGMEPPNYEELQALQPDLVIMSTGSASDIAVLDTINQLGLPVVVSNGWLENHYLARLEHMKLIASFYGKDEEADTYFETAKANIQEVMDEVSKETSQPDVLWGSIFMGTCYVPGSDSYVAAWIGDAGGDYLFPDAKGTGSGTISAEELYARGKEANIFVYSSWYPYIENLQQVIDAAPILADIKPIVDDNVWCYQPWWYQIGDKIDEIILDLAALFHPDLFPNHEIQHLAPLTME